MNQELLLKQIEVKELELAELQSEIDHQERIYYKMCNNYTNVKCEEYIDKFFLDKEHNALFIPGMCTMRRVRGTVRIKSQGKMKASRPLDVLHEDMEFYKEVTEEEANKFIRS